MLMQRIVLVSVLSLSAGACATRVLNTPHSLPAEVQLNLSRLPRVWVAGFATEGKPEFDVNAETVRLLRAHLRTWTSAPVVEAEPVAVDGEQRLSDVGYWQRLGEEHGWPLIVTGSVKLLMAPPKIEQIGRRSIYFPKAGRILEATVILIDGHSGQVVSTRTLPSRTRYGSGGFSSALSLFLQMMDQSMPDWLMTIRAYRPR
jgi:hypothetical protein